MLPSTILSDNTLATCMIDLDPPYYGKIGSNVRVTDPVTQTSVGFKSGKLMSNFVLNNPRCVLIHIPKNGGTSIRNGAWAGDYERPPVFGVIPKEWKPLFKFAFIRHPLDRFVSAWKMFTQGTHTDGKVNAQNGLKPLTDLEFLDIVRDETIIFDERRKTYEERIRHHTIPQTHPFNCLEHADFVGRYESFDDDFRQLIKKLGAEKELPRLHWTKRRTWREELSSEAIEACKDYYDEDFRALGYEAS